MFVKESADVERSDSKQHGTHDRDEKEWTGMRVRYRMVNAPRYSAEFFDTSKQAKQRFNEIIKDKYCVWAELVADEEDEGEYMEVLTAYENDNAPQTYRADVELRKIVQELFGG